MQFTCTSLILSKGGFWKLLIDGKTNNRYALRKDVLASNGVWLKI